MKWFTQSALALLAALPGVASAQSVLTYHNTPDRSGLYTFPGLTLAEAPKVRIDPKFKATAISGNVYAQPLYWQALGAKTGILVVATEANIVYGLNADTGKVVWQTQLATPAPQSSLGCGNIDPEGVTGTPVIDQATGTLYVDAMAIWNKQPRQMIYALNASTGAILPNWPFNVQLAMTNHKATFDSTIQGERSALQFFKGKLYVNYAGRFGDCGGYHGTVIEVNPSGKRPTLGGNWETRSAGGGIWAQAGATVDGTGVIVTTGNTFSPSTWEDGEAVVRLMPGLARSTNTKDYFTPSNWLALDQSDADLGGTGALPFTIPTATGGTASRVLALGKDGNGYLLNGANLGGIGHALQVLQLSNTRILTEPAIYNAKSDTLIAFTNDDGAVPNCSGANIMMLKITSSTPNPMTVAWCAPINGRGAPIITTTNGVANPIVWVVGAEGDNKLHAFNALNGNPLFSSGTTMQDVQHFSTLIAANNHLYVAGAGRIYGFAIPQ
jgi:outer membrane protein assembly factor BamB